MDAFEAAMQTLRAGEVMEEDGVIVETLVILVER